MTRYKGKVIGFSRCNAVVHIGGSTSLGDIDISKRNDEPIVQSIGEDRDDFVLGGGDVSDAGALTSE